MAGFDFMSPGRSWYGASVDAWPRYPAHHGDMKCDVVIIGGGFTGFSAACHLARAGVDVILIDERRFGDGASGRNGGQLGTGQRQWVEALEKDCGFERAKALFDLAESAKPYLFDFARTSGIDMDYRPGHMSVVHKTRYLSSYRAHVETMVRYGYSRLSFMEREETAERLGSVRYSGGIRDMGTGHIHPLKLLIGTMHAAERAGARLFEKTRALSVNRQNGVAVVRTACGTITAGRALLATNGYGGNLEPVAAARVLPIRSFIGATEPLGQYSPVLPGGESVDDSRFVVRYFRKTPDNRLLFGGSETYGNTTPGNMEERVRDQLRDVYPDLADVRFTHIWGGTVGITVQRLPFVCEVKPGIVYCGGYSGHGVMLSHFFGRLYAESVLGGSDRLQYMKELKISRFPGGILRSPLLFVAMTWFSLLDEI